MVNLTRKLVGRLKAFPKAAWEPTFEIGSPDGYGNRETAVVLTLKGCSGHTFKVRIAEGRFVKTWLDGEKLGLPYNPTKISWIEELYKPEVRLGRHLWRMFSGDVRIAAKTQRAAYQLANEEHRKSLLRDEALKAAIQSAEAAL